MSRKTSSRPCLGVATTRFSRVEYANISLGTTFPEHQLPWQETQSAIPGFANVAVKPMPSLPSP